MPPAVFLALESEEWNKTNKLPYIAILVFGIFCIGITICGFVLHVTGK